MARSGSSVVRRSRAASLLRAAVAAIVLATTSVAMAPPSFARDTATLVDDLANGQDFRLRVSAALALGKTNDASVRPPLEKALGSDSHPAVRAAAAAALGALGDTQAIDALRAAEKNDDAASVRSTAHASIAKLSAKLASSAKAKVLVKLGKMTNKSGVRGKELANVLQGVTRERAAKLPGVEVLAEDSDPHAAGAARKLPVIVLDGAIKRLSQSQSGSSTVCSAQVEYVLKRESALRGSVSGAAQAEDMADVSRDPQRLQSLQEAALAGAVESALRADALAMAAK